MFEYLWTLRNKTALYLIQPENYGDQEKIASKFSDCTIVNWLSDTLENANPSQRFVNTNVDLELNKIRQKGNSERKVFCFINNEYFLTRFSIDERKLFWQSLWSDFPHLNGVVVFFVLNSSEILPNYVDLDNWKKDERLIS